MIAYKRDEGKTEKVVERSRKDIISAERTFGYNSHQNTVSDLTLKRICDTV